MTATVRMEDDGEEYCGPDAQYRDAVAYKTASTTSRDVALLGNINIVKDVQRSCIAEEFVITGHSSNCAVGRCKIESMENRIYRQSP